ncbi:MAG: Nif3-like dinuclear metal center hexameric protein [Ignavibacteriales bacterium]|nr:Nif3-like dinuclear metal center hexameric protein [Ignavibacteriales bacterium]
MKGNGIITYLENWSPKAIAWQKDNVGLQVGSAEEEVQGILLCLELTESALKEAIKKRCNFIITHHPLIFQPIKSLNFTQDKTSKLIQELIKNNITLYSAHTNLDFTKDGVSYQLAKALSLTKIKFLKNLDSNQFKLVTFVPKENLLKLSNALFEAGAGKIGEYNKCSYRLEGKGTFEGSENSQPVIGSAMKFEEVDEVRLEMILDQWNLRNVITALLKNHPYEEPAYDVYPLANENLNYGMGAIGELENEMEYKSFLKYVEEKIGGNFRFCKGNGDKIKTVAVCGGSGSDLLSAAISKEADAFIAADVKYHTFHDAEDKILLIDAGHYETEIFILYKIKDKLDRFLQTEKPRIKTVIFKRTTNPVHFYKN